MKKNQKGVTLIALAVTIIVIIIIASVTFYSGISTIQDSKQQRLSSELIQVQHSVLEMYSKYKILNEEDCLIGTEVTSIEDIPTDYRDVLKNSESAFKDDALKVDKYYKLDATISDTKNQEDFKKIGIAGANFSYIVCYKTGEVMNIDVSTDSQGRLLYTSLE